MKIKIYIRTNYIVEQRSDKCNKHENVKKRGGKNNTNIQEQDKKENYLKTFAQIELVTLHIKTWCQFVSKKHLIDETVKLVVAFFEYGKIRCEIFRCRIMFISEIQPLTAPAGSACGIVLLLYARAGFSRLV